MPVYLASAFFVAPITLLMEIAGVIKGIFLPHASLLIFLLILCIILRRFLLADPTESYPIEILRRGQGHKQL